MIYYITSFTNNRLISLVFSSTCRRYLIINLKYLVICLLDIKFKPLKISLRAVLDVISFANRQEINFDFDKTVFIYSMRALEDYKLIGIFIRVL